MQDPGTVHGGVQGQRPVQILAAVGVGLRGAGKDLRADLGQAAQAGPDRAAATRITSASSRHSSGMARVHFASCRATDLAMTWPSVSAASRTGWSRASR